jgi:uncharacterized protein YecT (DUF1311 family)
VTRWRGPVLAAALALAVGAALAVSVGAASAGTYERCLQQAATTFATSECNRAELRRVERLHDQALRTLTTSLDASRRALLTASERRWVVFRDAECELDASQAAGGTLQPILFTACRIQLTAERTAQLRRHLRP